MEGYELVDVHASLPVPAVNDRASVEAGDDERYGYAGDLFHFLYEADRL
jgi:hypothetical protein